MAEQRPTHTVKEPIAPLGSHAFQTQQEQSSLISELQQTGQQTGLWLQNAH